MKDYWAVRAKKYNKLQWVKNETLLKELINYCNLDDTLKVLDMGCGTGTVSKIIADTVSKVFAIDKSQDMLNQVERRDNIVIMCEDLEKSIVATNFFDRIIARMVFHHIINLPEMFENCYEMLKENGWLIIQEGGVIPETEPEVFNWYSDMIALKENRTNFTVESLRKYFTNAGFKNIEEKVIVDNKFSINNWLSNSGQNKKILKEIYDLHYNASDNIKKYYNMRIKEKEITIDSRVLIIRGQK